MMLTGSIQQGILENTYHNIHSNLVFLLKLAIDVGHIVQNQSPVGEMNERNSSGSSPKSQRGNPGREAHKP